MCKPSHPITTPGTRFPQTLGSQPWLPETEAYYLSVQVVPIGTSTMRGEGQAECVPIHHICHNILVLTLLLPRALLEMLESLLATISTSLAKIPMQVELSSPERQLGGRVHKLYSCSPQVSMGRVGIGKGYSHHREGIQPQMYSSAWSTSPQTHSSSCPAPSLGMLNQEPKLQIQANS